MLQLYFLSQQVVFKFYLQKCLFQTKCSYLFLNLKELNMLAFLLKIFFYFTVIYRDIFFSLGFICVYCVTQIPNFIFQHKKSILGFFWDGNLLDMEFYQNQFSSSKTGPFCGCCQVPKHPHLCCDSHFLGSKTLCQKIIEGES